MYSVSQDYITKLFDISKKRRAIYALLDAVEFNENDIVANSLKYTLQCVGGAEINLGGVFLGQLFLTFTKPFAARIPRGSWKGKKITLEIGLEIDSEQEEFEFVPIGEFFIEEANHTTDGVEITAYDAMRKFDRNLNLSTTSGGLYSLTTFACNQCGVELGMTREEFDDLPNGEETFSVYPENDMKTYRDLLSWIGVTIGGYCTINREGKLEYRGWQSEPVISMGINDRFEKGSWSDFHTWYTGISVTNIADQTTSYYHTAHDDGLTMNVGANPLLQYGLEETKERQRRAILDALENFDYVPFKCSAFADVFFDLGDVISFTDGLAGTSSKCCVMRIDFSFSKGITLQGFGKNPALFGAQSKTDKDISGLAAQNKANTVKLIKYTNVEDIEYSASSEENLLLATLELSTDKEGWVEVQTTFMFMVKSQLAMINGNGRYLHELIRYKIDGEEVSRFKNHKYFYSGANADFPFAVEHYFAIQLDANVRKTMTIEFNKDFLYIFSTTSGNNREDDYSNSRLYCFAGDLNVYVKGQCLSETPSWDGLITLADEIERVHIGNVGARPIADNVVVTITNNQPIDLTDEVAKMEIGSVGIVPLSESLSIVLTTPTFNTVDETGEYNIVSEDGLYNLITE